MEKSKTSKQDALLRKNVKAMEQFCAQNFKKHTHKGNEFIFRIETSELFGNVNISVTVEDDYLMSVASPGITVPPDKLTEVLTAVNYINCAKVLYGRFVVTRLGELQFHYLLDLNKQELKEIDCNTAIVLPMTECKGHASDIKLIIDGKVSADEYIKISLQ